MAGWLIVLNIMISICIHYYGILNSESVILKSVLKIFMIIYYSIEAIIQSVYRKEGLSMMLF